MTFQVALIAVCRRVNINSRTCKYVDVMPNENNLITDSEQTTYFQSVCL